MAPIIIMVHCSTSVKNTAVKPPARAKGTNFDENDYLPDCVIIMLGKAVQYSVHLSL